MSYSVVIIDDEPPARAKLQRFIAELADFRVIAEAGTVEEDAPADAAPCSRTGGVSRLGGLPAPPHRVWRPMAMGSARSRRRQR